ncbi:MAG: hypothetical protein VW268_05830 [Rhodospirillaceae bacterium]
MLKKFWNWFVKPEADGRRLNRDVAFIINSLREGHYGPIAPEVAADLRGDIDYVFNTFINRDEAFGHKRALDHLKRMHGEARRRRDQRALTSLTLAIIYIRAGALGDLGTPARDAVDGYLSEFAHQAQEDSGALPPQG